MSEQDILKGISPGRVFVLLSLDDWNELKRTQEEILELLKKAGTERSGGPRFADYISAAEFMKECNIKRWKFDQLIAENKIRTVKKKRKIYVPISEVGRYFKDPEIQ